MKICQRHPFTLVSTQPAEFVIQAQGGFTKALHLAACRNPGGTYRAAIEGPYCVVPNTQGYDKVMLIAGGTGATFTVAMALDWARRHRTSQQRSTLDFVWIVRNKTSFGWLDVELSELRSRAGVNVALYVSGADSKTGEKAGSPSTIQPFSESASSLSSVYHSSSTSDGHEKMAYELTRQPIQSSGAVPENFRSGRPELSSLIKDAVSEMAVDDRVLVTGELFSQCSHDEYGLTLSLNRLWVKCSLASRSPGCGLLQGCGCSKHESAS